LKKIIMLGIGLLSFLLTIFLAPQEAPARPEIAAGQNAPCWKCHVNPTGGGQRNATGFFMSGNLSLEATATALAEKYPDFGSFTPAIGDRLLLGADARMIWHDIQDDPDVPDETEGPNSATFFLMQAAAYADAQVLPVLHVVAGYDMANNVYEAYGLLDHLPAGLYARVGRFLPPYGLRMDDHTIFTRDEAGFSNLGHDTGVEIGVRPGPAFVLAALTNGNLGDRAQDRDGDYYAVTAQTGVRFWKIGLGGSYFHNTREGLEQHVYGPWASFGLWRLVLLGELAVAQNQFADATDAEDGVGNRFSSTGFAQLDLEIIRGLHLQGRYAHLDSDWETDESYRDQAMGGVMVYPLPYVQTLFQYRHNREPEEQETENDELLAQVHFWF